MTDTNEHGGLGSRAAAQALADRMLAAVAPYASPAGAHVLLPGPGSASGRRSDGLEGFARTFLLAAFRVRGADGADATAMLGGFARGLCAGVDPSSPERWPTIAERRQAVVEAASIAIALSETRPWLWDLLPDADRDRVVAWLGGIVGTSGYTNNWIWFQTVIESFLRSVGGPWSQDDLDRNTEIQESLYVGDGWYSDGASPAGTRQSFDYYAGWAWHVYPLLAARIDGVQLAGAHLDRLRAFVPEAQALIGRTGAPVLQGRSATYRFALLAPLWAGAIAGTGALEPGRTRAIADATISYFLSRGALDDAGLLSIGWHGRFTPLRQPYTSGGSPYWGASKGLLGLLLPADHPEWTARPDVDEPPVARVRALRAPGWLISTTSGDDIVRLYNHGSDGWRHTAGAARADNPFYERIGYSNATSPEISRSGIAAPLESHVALLDAHGLPSHRDAIERLHLSDRVGVSRSRVHWYDGPDSPALSDAALAVAQRRGPLVTVASVLNGAHELRLAWWAPEEPDPLPAAVRDLDSAWPLDPGPWRVRIGGWALSVTGRAWHATDARATRADGLSSSVNDVVGVARAGTRHRVGGSPLAEGSVTPYRQSAEPVDALTVVAARVTLTTRTAGAAATAGEGIGCRVEVVAEGVRVVWDDGQTDLVPTDDPVRV